MIEPVSVLMVGIVHDVIDSQQILVRRIPPHEFHGVSAFRKQVFPGRLQFPGGILHRHDGNMVQPAVYPDFDLGHIRVIGFRQREDFRTDMTCGHPVSIVRRDVAETYEIRRISSNAWA